MRTVFLRGQGAGVMNSYEFACFGRDLHVFKHTLASFTALLDGARVRISGRDDTIREAIRMVREWMRRTN
ncbi:MAG: hypothetical protein DMD85_13960 [Candidatus Rokuibacteriota bacterium]|nr:MAG: hypothetical protein DMD85_13960 [Candidatus Rokubacteria bacterium]